jgi:serine/threonine protein kinase
MSLAPGAHLGPFEILAPIGAGGMGEVYRAKDTKLKREVALKVLPDSFAGDHDRMARFQREAEMLASLNHRNIAQIYGVEDRAIVMELVEGETLSSPLPIETALNYARQIAEALEYAHERGVIHRDLKPTNIKVTPDGTVKLLDFGLAKAIEDPTASRDDPEHSPTLTLGVTRVGVILGTAAYMSPEQASGKTADRRADIWGFGAVLYEMLSGKRAFAGESVSDTLASVLKTEPDWKALPAETPASIRRLIRRCLTKDRKQRLQAIGEARIAIDQSLSGAPPETAEPMLAGRSILPWAVAGVSVVGLAVALWALWGATRPIEQRLVWLDVDLGTETSLLPLGSNTNSVIISPDGTRLVYVASAAGGPSKLFSRRLDQPNASDLPGTEGTVFPFFSPDGQWVGFADPNFKLDKISVEGGAVVSLGDNRAYGTSWGEDGSLIACQSLGKGMVLLPSRGGPATPVTELANGEIGHAYPQMLPGGKAVLFTAYIGGPEIDKASIEVVRLSDRRRRTLVRGGTSPHYVGLSNGSGHLVYNHKGTLFAIAFDLNRLETHGTAFRVLDGVAYEAFSGVAHFDVSRTGTLVYRKWDGGTGDRVTTVQWLDAAGKREPLLRMPGNYGDLSLSPDGKRLAVSVGEGSTRDICVYDPQRDMMMRLTFGGGLYLNPVWSPDGRYVVFGSVAGGSGMFWARADGSGQPQVLPESEDDQPASFSPDGKRLAYNRPDNESGKTVWQIWTVPIEDSGGQLKVGKPEQFLKTRFNDLAPAFSPDGRWLAYESNESGRSEVYVRTFLPGAAVRGGKWQISNSGGRLPVWSRKKRELLYQSGDQIMAMDYAVKGDSFVPGKPRVWAMKIEGAPKGEGPIATWFDLAADGKHLAVEVPVATPVPPKPQHEVTLVFNFFDELRRRAPVGK